MRLVEAARSHVPFLAANMRVADVIECEAIGRTPAEALANALMSSLWSLTAIVGDEPHAMMGVTSRSMIDGVGVPWMLGTERVYDHARDLIRYAPVIIDEMQRTFGILENLVSVDNARALRFLKHVGFEIYPEVSMVGATAFVRFRKGAT